MADTIKIPAHRCPACRVICEPIRDGNDLVSLCCDEVVEIAVLCECGAEAHTGCEECLACIVDGYILDPEGFVGTAELEAEIAKALAARLRPFLRQRQAA